MECIIQAEEKQIPGNLGKEKEGWQERAGEQIFIQTLVLFSFLSSSHHKVCDTSANILLGCI